jgi:septum formation protein
LFLEDESGAAMSRAPPLILASTSAYRRELLGRLGIGFTCQSPGIEESVLGQELPMDRALRLAHAKAHAIAERSPHACIIGADQVAVCGEQLLEKPGAAAASRTQLQRLSGASARFYTGCALLCPARGLRLAHLDTTVVSFRALEAPEIERYVAHDEPYDCAGGFKAERLGIALMESIESSDPTALIGLPLIWVADALRRAGYRVP